MGQVNVTLNGRTFQLWCGDGQEDYVQHLSSHISQHIDELKKSFGAIRDEELFLMAGLMVADELREAREDCSSADVAPQIAAAGQPVPTAAMGSAAEAGFDPAMAPPPLQAHNANPAPENTMPAMSAQIAQLEQAMQQTHKAPPQPAAAYPQHQQHASHPDQASVPDHVSARTVRAHGQLRQVPQPPEEARRRATLTPTNPAPTNPAPTNLAVDNPGGLMPQGIDDSRLRHALQQMSAQLSNGHATAELLADAAGQRIEPVFSRPTPKPSKPGTR